MQLIVAVEVGLTVYKAEGDTCAKTVSRPFVTDQAGERGTRGPPGLTRRLGLCR